ncbi:hypothetical protein CUC08_Gglean005112 [Alternaria sp. MG1]|nr:hypothetical protein CUC08_Gglean005112 [Alternaria sp. MG1]
MSVRATEQLLACNCRPGGGYSSTLAHPSLRASRSDMKYMSRYKRQMQTCLLTKDMPSRGLRDISLRMFGCRIPISTISSCLNIQHSQPHLHTVHACCDIAMGIATQ